MALTKKQKAVVSKWVKALRSGKYKQGKGALHKVVHKTDRFCCLGVLCDLAVKAKVIPKPKLDCHKEYDYDGNTGCLPEAVKDWAGLYGGLGGFEDGSLAELNDEGKKFATIAKVIESKPEGMFV